MICRASQAAVGWRVTSNHRSCRRLWPRTKKANNPLEGQRWYNAHIRPRQSLQRDCEEKSSSFATAAYRLGPYILRPSTGQPCSQASTARHGSATHPTVRFPCSCAGSIREARDRSSVGLPYSEISRPEGPKSSAMPTKDCFRLNDLDPAKKAWAQSNHPN